MTGVGAPWYTSGAQTWKGTADALKNSPARTSAVPRERRGEAPFPATCAERGPKSTVPAAP